MDATPSSSVSDWAGSSESLLAPADWPESSAPGIMPAMTTAPVFDVLLYSSLAALAAAVGVVPRALGFRPGPTVYGWSNAVAAGLMFGVAYVLMTVGLQAGFAAGGVGAVLGVVVVRATHAVTGSGELDLMNPSEAPAALGRRAVVSDLLHGAHEGLAIGVAMTLSLPLGIAVAGALAVHNVPEAMILTRVLSAQSMSRGRAALLAVASNAAQPLLAVTGFLALREVPAAVPAVTGFAVATLLYLVLEELLPESYHQAGHTSIAVVTALAMGVVVLLAGVS